MGTIVFDQSPETSPGLIANQKLLIRRDSKRHRRQRTAAQFPMLRNPLAIRAERPKRSELPVAVNVGAFELGQFFAAVKLAAGDTCSFLVRMRYDRRKDRRGADGLFGPNRLLAPLGDAPSIIPAGRDAINHLPKFPPDITDPERA